MSPSRRGNQPRYPRKARVGELLREVLAEELEKVSDEDDRLPLLTITAVDPDPDLRHAKVLLSSLPEGVAPVLEEHRHRFQAAIGRQVRMKRTPLLSFHVDPGVQTGQRIEDILRTITPQTETKLPEVQLKEEDGDETD